MTTLVKIGVASAIVAGAIGIVPALKGPFNRLRNEANERLSDEFVVDNYKAEYVKLHEKRVEIKKNIENFYAEKRVVEAKLEKSNYHLDIAKSKLIAIGAKDLAAFNQAKDVYESFKIENENLVAMQNVYSNAIAKLEMSLRLVEENMRKAKTNVEAISSKKVLVDSIKSVNGIIANLQGIGEDPYANVALEKLDENALRESIKLEALSTNSLPCTLSEVEAKAYIESIK